MDLTVNEYIDSLLSEEAHKRPSDYGKVEDLELKMKLPEWFDDKKYNQGRRFFWDFCFTLIASMTLGLVALFSVPSILKVLTGTRRSNSVYTAYKRYVSTFMHVYSWFKYELKPGTESWRSLHTVRTRHLKAAIAATKKGHGTVSQRDLALTQFAFIGFAMVKPGKLSLKQIKNGDWESYNHFWRTVGYMMGIEDRYNLCRKNVDETREACQILLERVFTPCLENVPEYFEHAAHSLLEGISVVNSYIQPKTVLFVTRYLADVPGYVYSEAERILFQKKLKDHLKGRSEDIGVDTTELICKSAVDGLPNRPPRLLYVRDFDTIETTPGYRRLNFAGKYHLALDQFIILTYGTDIGRIFINLIYGWMFFTIFYFPFKALMRFGFKNSFVNMFVEDPKDDTELKPNSEYDKPLPPDTWYGKICTVLW